MAGVRSGTVDEGHSRSWGAGVADVADDGVASCGMVGREGGGGEGVHALRICARSCMCVRVCVCVCGGGGGVGGGRLESDMCGSGKKPC